jgi:mono/diheme cytochrome c family protein
VSERTNDFFCEFSNARPPALYRRRQMVHGALRAPKFVIRRRTNQSRGDCRCRQSCGTQGRLALNEINESRVLRFLVGPLTGSAGALIVWIVVLLSRPLLLSAQTLRYTDSPDVTNGEKVYKGGCIACHGSKGKGAPAASTVFTRLDTFPDFTDCAGTTPEPDGNWKAVIVHGGPSRGLSQIMPAFGDLLTDQEINDVIAYMRGFCKNAHHDPLGELNLPRALVTEKAFPENEIVISTARVHQARPRGLRMSSTNGRSSTPGPSLKPISR